MDTSAVLSQCGTARNINYIIDDGLYFRTPLHIRSYETDACIFGTGFKSDGTVNPGVKTDTGTGDRFFYGPLFNHFSQAGLTVFPNPLPVLPFPVICLTVHPAYFFQIFFGLAYRHKFHYQEVIW